MILEILTQDVVNKCELLAGFFGLRKPVDNRVLSVEVAFSGSLGVLKLGFSFPKELQVRILFII